MFLKRQFSHTDLTTNTVQKNKLECSRQAKQGTVKLRVFSRDTYENWHNPFLYQAQPLFSKQAFQILANTNYSQNAYENIPLLTLTSDLSTHMCATILPVQISSI